MLATASGTFFAIKRDKQLSYCIRNSTRALSSPNNHHTRATQNTPSEHADRASEPCQCACSIENHAQRRHLARMLCAPQHLPLDLSPPARPSLRHCARCRGCPSYGCAVAPSWKLAAEGQSTETAQREGAGSVEEAAALGGATRAGDTLALITFELEHVVVRDFLAHLAQR